MGSGLNIRFHPHEIVVHLSDPLLLRDMNPGKFQYANTSTIGASMRLFL